MVSSSYRKGKENKVVLVISLVIYVVALFNTAYYVYPINAVITPDSEMWYFIQKGVPCWQYFFTFFIFFPVSCFEAINGVFDFGWVALTNLFYFYCYMLFLRNKRKKRTLILMGVSSLFIIIRSFFHYRIDPRDHDIVFNIGRKGLGYYLWLLSYLCLFIGRWLVPEPPMNTVKDDM